MKLATCRLCGAPLTTTFIDLGLSPLANSFISANKVDEGEEFFPLHVWVCGRCFLVQLEEFKRPEAIFSDYAYFSSYSTTWLKHAEAYVAAMTRRFALAPQSKVVEVASNDGYLLKYFVARGLPVLGVEPAANVATVAEAADVPTDVAFFGKATAERLLGAGHAADLMTANNVLAHVPDIVDFAAGFAVLLKPEGVATFEFPHLLRLIAESQFDTIYHEHFSYLSLGVAIRLMARVGLRVFDVERLSTHGGSLRVFVCREGASHPKGPAVAEVLAEEEAAGLSSLAGYSRFAEGAVDIKCRALEFLIKARGGGKTVCAHGAAAKGNTFLNYCGIGPEFVKLVSDNSPHKQGTFLPGSRIPVITPNEMLAERPDYLLILPWNLKEEIAEEFAAIREWGGRFVTAVPELKVF